MRRTKQYIEDSMLMARQLAIMALHNVEPADAFFALGDYFKRRKKKLNAVAFAVKRENLYNLEKILRWVNPGPNAKNHIIDPAIVEAVSNATYGPCLYNELMVVSDEIRQEYVTKHGSFTPETKEAEFYRIIGHILQRDDNKKLPNKERTEFFIENARVSRTTADQLRSIRTDVARLRGEHDVRDVLENHAVEEDYILRLADLGEHTGDMFGAMNLAAELSVYDGTEQTREEVIFYFALSKLVTQQTGKSILYDPVNPKIEDFIRFPDEQQFARFKKDADAVLTLFRYDSPEAIIGGAMGRANGFYPTFVVETLAKTEPRDLEKSYDHSKNGTTVKADETRQALWQITGYKKMEYRLGK